MNLEIDEAQGDIFTSVYVRWRPSHSRVGCRFCYLSFAQIAFRVERVPIRGYMLACLREI